MNIIIIERHFIRSYSIFQSVGQVIPINKTPRGTNSTPKNIYMCAGIQSPLYSISLASVGSWHPNPSAHPAFGTRYSAFSFQHPVSSFQYPTHSCRLHH